MRSKLGMRVAFAATALLSAATMAKADFWSDAGANYKGVTLHGVSESTPPSNYIKDVLAPAFEQGDRHQGRDSRRRPGTRCTTRRSRTWRPRPASMTSSTSSRTSSMPTCRANFLVDITKSLKDDPSLEGAGLRSDELHHLRQLLQERRRRPLRRADGSLHQDLSLPHRPLQRPEDQGSLQGQVPARTWRRPRPTRNTRRSPSSSPSGARTTAWSCGAPRCRRIPATRHPGTSSSRSIAPTFGVYNWGINADKNYAASVANGGTMNSPEAKAALKYWLHLRDIAPPESTAEHLERGRDDLRRRPRRAGPRLRRERRLDRHRRGEVARSSAMSASRCRRSSPASWRTPKPARATSATMTAAPSAFRHLEEQGSGAALPAVHRPGLGAGRTGRSPRRASPTPSTYDDPEGHGDGQEARRLLHDAQGRGQAVRRRSALSVPCPGARGDRADLLRSDLPAQLSPDEGLDQMAAAAEDELTNLGYRK